LKAHGFGETLWLSGKVMKKLTEILSSKLWQKHGFGVSAGHKI
jgi:hypothetical protein